MIGVRLAKRDQAETVNQGRAAADHGRKAHAKGGHQRHGHGRGGDAAGVVCDADDLVGCDAASGSSPADVAADDEVLNGPALENADHADDQSDTDRERDRIAKACRIALQSRRHPRSTTPASAAAAAASPATAIRAGSATVVPKPRANPKTHRSDVSTRLSFAKACRPSIRRAGTGPSPGRG